MVLGSRIAKWVAALVLLVAIVLFASVVMERLSVRPSFVDPEAPAPLRLDKAQILLSDSPLPPPDSAPWKPQRLPDNWSLTRPGVGGFAWYRVEFTLAAEARQMSALHVPKVSMNGAAYINGEFIGSGGHFSEPMTRQWYRPQLYDIPASLLKVGRNVIHYRVKAYANDAGGLSEMYFGPAAPVTRQWGLQNFWQVVSLQMTGAMTLGLSALALFAWMMRSWSDAYGYYGASVLLWGFRDGHFQFRELPMPVHAWDVLVASSQIWVLLLMFMYLLRVQAVRRPWLEHAMWIFAVLAPCVLWLVPPLQFRHAVSACNVILLLTHSYIITELARLAWRERSTTHLMQLGATVAVFGLCVHDWLNYASLLDFDTRYYLHYGPPILFVAVAWNLFVRFTEAQDAADDLTHTLESRIAEKTAELARTHERIRAAEAEKARSMERERFMQEMHDGLGSQLVSSLAMAQAGELDRKETCELLRSCIDDLRLAIDTSNDAEDSLALALGNLRFRMAPRLKAAGIALHWHTDLDGAEQALPPGSKLPILRILQESITNTLKHAQAKSLLISVACSADTLDITVRDDGEGFDVAAARQRASGKGLNGLEKRARTLGASLEVASSPRGTSIHLRLGLTPLGAGHGEREGFA